MPHVLFLAMALLFAPSLLAEREPGVLRWGGDAEGGAPFVEADPANPDVVRGFDVEIAGEIAKRLGMTPRFVQVGYSAIDQSVERGDFDIGLSGVEDTAARRESRAATLPYFEFREVLTIRAKDRDRIHGLADLRGRRVGTLGGTIAYDILLLKKGDVVFEVVSYDDDVHPYEDLISGRLDAVLLDHVIAARAERRLEGLATLSVPVARGHYVGVLASGDGELRDRANDALRAMMRDGTLERILRTWDCWDDEQSALYERIVRGNAPPPFEFDTGSVTAPPRAKASVTGYLPALFRAALITIVLSCVAMALAVAFGIAIASGRIYGGPITRALLTTYVEIVRGTPLLLQLFVIYYGLSSIVKLPAFVAALLGLGINYAAFESEIYRGSLQAISRGQLEAARTLGLTEGQVFRLVRAPQALRLALAPMTNDFVALLKDSSLVSVITVVELTKQTSILASNLGSWLVPGLLCAAIYLAMSLPLAHLAGRLEERWKVRS